MTKQLKWHVENSEIVVQCGEYEMREILRSKSTITAWVLVVNLTQRMLAKVKK